MTGQPRGYRWRGITRRGGQQSGRITLPPDGLAAHVEALFRAGWRCLMICSGEGPVPPRPGEDNQVAGISKRPGTGKRVWWAEASEPEAAAPGQASHGVCREMTAARFDETVARLATAHALPVPVAQAAIGRTAGAINGLRTPYHEVLFHTGKDLGTARDGGFLTAPHPRVRALAAAIAAELGHPGWLGDRMAADAPRCR